MNLESWAAEGRQLARTGQANSWQIADWLLAGETAFGEKLAYKDAGTIFELARGTLYNYASVARAFDVSRRRETLSFKHHAEVRALPPDQQAELLDRAVRENLNVRDLRKLVRPPKPESTEPPKKTVRIDAELFRRLEALATADGKMTVDELAGSLLAQWLHSYLAQSPRARVIVGDQPCAVVGVGKDGAVEYAVNNEMLREHVARAAKLSKPCAEARSISAAQQEDARRLNEAELNRLDKVHRQEMEDLRVAHEQLEKSTNPRDAALRKRLKEERKALREKQRSVRDRLQQEHNMKIYDLKYKPNKDIEIKMTPDGTLRTSYKNQRLEIDSENTPVEPSPASPPVLAAISEPELAPELAAIELWKPRTVRECLGKVGCTYRLPSSAW